MFRLWIGPVDVPVEVPAMRARIVTVLPIAGRDVLAVAFGHAMAGVATTALLALVGWDGAQLRILALEPLTVRRGDGAGFSLHPRATADRQHIQLDCIATMARPVTQPFRLVWTDWLGWQDGAPLVDAAAHAPLAGTWQAELAALRRVVTAWLAAMPRTTLTTDNLAGLGMLQPFGCMADR